MEGKKSASYCLLRANESQLFGWQMLPEVGNISVPVLENVNRVRPQSCWYLYVAASLGPEATVLLLPAQGTELGGAAPTQPSPP